MTTPVARYGFLPYLRVGIATKIQQSSLSAGQLRASVEMSIQASSTASAQSYIASRSVELRGPGDVIGIDPRVIVRTDPRPGASDFEGNLFPLIDFRSPDFPWRYTPLSAGDGSRRQLKPWLCLIVLREDEIPDGIRQTKPLPRVAVPAVALPDLAESWAWAHVQVSDTVDAPVPLNFNDRDAVRQHMLAHPHLAVSRIVSTRRLAKRTRYVACVVPTFEAGRRAGLGLPLEGIMGEDAAWSGGNGKVDLCVYYSFEFFTGEADFELLARRLEGKKLGSNIGYRDIDASDPGPDTFIPRIAPAEGRTDRKLRLGGALLSLIAKPDLWPDSNTPPDPFQAKLQQLLNVNAIDGGEDDPFLVPPIYGRWHAATHRVGTAETVWLDQLNLDPRHRVAAAFGTESVQNRQDAYVAEAWRQIGDLELANDAIRAGQAGIAMQQRLHEKYLSALPVETFVALTRPMHGRIMNAGRTVLQELRESKSPAAVLSPAYRKAARPGGPLIRHSAQTAARSRLLERLNAGDINVPPRIELGGVVSLDARGEVSGWMRPIINVLDRMRRNRAAAVVRRMKSAMIETMSPIPRIDLHTKARWTGAPDRKDPASIPERARSLQASQFQSAAARALRDAEAVLPVVQLRAVDPRTLRTTTLTAVRPAITIPAAVLAILDLDAAVVPTTERFDTIMDHPVFVDPMYEPLRDLSQAHLLPGAEMVELDSVGLLLTSYEFIEAYLVGVNHEMALELLWREYPTDQRGSYFRQFWDIIVPGTLPPARAPEREPFWDIAPIHQWGRTSTLGTHPSGQNAPPRRDNIVLLIRGQLLEKYPNTLIYAVKAAAHVIDGATYYKRKADAIPRLPIFRGKMPPDMTFVGFDLTEAEVRQGDGWMFVLEEPLTESRFGLDFGSDQAPTTAPTHWNNLEWGHLGGNMFARVDPQAALITAGMPRPKGTSGPSLVWGRDSATMAAITLQLPVRVLFHSSRMLPEPEDA